MAMEHALSFFRHNYLNKFKVYLEVDLEIEMHSHTRVSKIQFQIDIYFSQIIP